MGLINKIPFSWGKNQVPKVGVEPTWTEAHYALNVARLPIPPLRHPSYFTFNHKFVNYTCLLSNLANRNAISSHTFIMYVYLSACYNHF
jgi:hypothetical protein